MPQLVGALRGGYPSGTEEQVVKLNRILRPARSRGVLLPALAVLAAGATAPLYASGVAEAPGPAPADTRGRITVSAAIDTEGALLGSLIALVLADNGFRVDDRIGLGPADVVRRAALDGEVDIYPDYTGNGALWFDEAGTAVWRNAAAGYERVRALDMESNGLVWLSPAPASNSRVIAVRSELAGAGVRTMEDIGPWMAEGNRFTLAVGEALASRPDGLPAFEEAYGFRLDPQDLRIVPGGASTAALQALAGEAAEAAEAAEVSAAMAYGTDAGIAALGLHVLEDTRRVQPVYRPAPVVRSEILERYPQVERLLQPVFAQLSGDVLRALNAAIAVDGRSARDVAGQYLSENGFID